MIKSFTVEESGQGRYYQSFENDYRKKVKTLSIIGPMGLTFWINEMPHPIMIYSVDGVWEWNINGQTEIKNIIFDPITCLGEKPQIIIEYSD